LTIEVELGNKIDMAEDLEGLAEAAGALWQDLRAARLWGAAAALRKDTGVTWASAERMLHEPQLLAARSRIHQAIWEAGFAEGQAMGLEEAVGYALSEEETTTASSQAPTQPLAHEQPPALTAWEREVAAMVGRGLSNRQIGSELHLSERTIEKHVSKILRKLELSSRTEIAAWATQQRLIAPHPD
jgi:DNA-binding CsgD family transcriptional regulator